MRRVSAWCFILVLIWGIVGAGEVMAQGRPVVIKHWIWLDQPQDPTFNQLVEEFMRINPDIKVEVELVGWGVFHSRLLTAVAAGSPPDTSKFKLWWLGQFVKMGALEPLDDYIAKWRGKEDVFDNLWNLVRGLPPTDQIYLMPYELVFLYLYYRPDWFKEAGLTPPKDLDEFLEAAKRMTKDIDGDGRIDRWGFGMRGARGGHEMWGSFVLSNNVKFFDERGNVVLNSPQAVEANQWYIDLFRQYKVVPPSAPTDGFAEIVGAFEAGRTAMTIHHIASAKRMVKKWGEGVSAIPVPKGRVGRWTSAGDTENAIYKAGKNKEAAFKFISWLSESEQMDKWSRSPNGQIPTLKSVAKLPHYQQDRFYRASIESADFASVFPATPPMAAWIEHLWPATFQRALLGEISSQEMMDILAKGMKEK